MAKKLFRKKTFRKFKRSYKKKRSSGSRLKKTVLGGSTYRILEQSYPVFMRTTGINGRGANGSYTAWYSFYDQGTAAYASSVHPLGDLNSPLSPGYDREFFNMSAVYSQVRLLRSSIRYIDTTGNFTKSYIQNAGPMSLSITPDTPPNTAAFGDNTAYFNNFNYDAALKIMPFQSSISKSRTYKQPTRSVTTTLGTSVNDWIPTANFTASRVTGLSLNIGQPTFPADTFTLQAQNGLNAVDTTVQIGSVIVKHYVEFAVPQSRNIQALP